MNSAEANSKYGRTDNRKAEPPAKPAATMNGMSGRQQLDAATTLANAPTLANTILRLAVVSFTVNLTCIAQRLPNYLKRGNPLRQARFNVGPATHACRSTSPTTDILTVNPHSRLPKEP